MTLKSMVKKAVAAEGIRPTARRIGVSVSLIRCIIEGRNVSISNAEKVANGFNTPLIFGSQTYLNKTRFNSEKKVIDEQRLRNAIEICEQGLDEADKTLLPEKKARLIIVIYSMIGKANTVAAIKPEVIRLIHLAA